MLCIIAYVNRPLSFVTLSLSPYLSLSLSCSDSLFKLVVRSSSQLYFRTKYILKQSEFDNTAFKLFLKYIRICKISFETTTQKRTKLKNEIFKNRRCLKMNSRWAAASFLNMCRFTVGGDGQLGPIFPGISSSRAIWADCYKTFYGRNLRIFVIS
jgi:hypothetical protein